MRTYIISDNQVTAHAERPGMVAESGLVVTALEELEGSSLGAKQLLAIWNALPGVEPVRKFKNRKTAVAQLWAAFEALPIAEPATGQRRVRADSKQAQVIALLRQPGGATLDMIAAATGWQRHTVRGAIAGALKKKLGLTIVAETGEEGARTYRIVAAAG